MIEELVQVQRANTDMAVTCSTIWLRDLEIMADIGAYHHEIGIPQRLNVSVVLHVLAPEADVIEQAYDYTNIRDQARALGDERIVLIETFARRLGEGLLAHPLVMQAEVRIEKPGALAGCVAGAQVTVRDVDWVC